MTGPTVPPLPAGGPSSIVRHEMRPCSCRPMPRRRKVNLGKIAPTVLPRTSTCLDFVERPITSLKKAQQIQLVSCGESRSTVCLVDDIESLSAPPKTEPNRTDNIATCPIESHPIQQHTKLRDVNLPPINPPILIEYSTPQPQTNSNNLATNRKERRRKWPPNPPHHPSKPPS